VYLSNPKRISAIGAIACCLAPAAALAQQSVQQAVKPSPFSPTNIFSPASTHADTILKVSNFTLVITALIFLTVFSLLLYAVRKFRRGPDDDGREPAQVYGSTQIEMAWTIIPTLIVVVLFLAASRVIANVQNKPKPANAVEVTVIGHQYWWEYRYPQFHFVTANELHVPVSDRAHPTPTFLKLLSADTDHSFWVPRLGGKTDLIPNHPNSMWIDPYYTGLYLGQCAQYCGTQHGKMLLRVYVDSQEDFDRWVREQSRPAQISDSVRTGRMIFERAACANCHTVAGTSAKGTFGPDLTHLMSRETLASGAIRNTHDNLRNWLRDPNVKKPGSLMPAMQLNDRDLDAVTAYMESLR
jgi:cytochrome c oxidase subunit 2